MTNTIDAFWAQVDKNGPGGCWLMTTHIRADGYAWFVLAGKRQKAHCLAFGPLPEGADELHHTCFVRHCVNRAHLMPVTVAQHRRIHGDLTTHCVQGHEYTEANTKWSKRGTRDCRECAKAASRAYRNKVRAATT